MKKYEYGKIFTEGVESPTIEGLSSKINNYINKYADSGYTVFEISVQSLLTNGISTIPIKHYGMITFIKKDNK